MEKITWLQSTQSWAEFCPEARKEMQIWPECERVKLADSNFPSLVIRVQSGLHTTQCLNIIYRYIFSVDAAVTSV